MPSNPSSDSAFLNQIAWRLAAGIAAAAALVAVILTHTKQQASAARVAASAPLPPAITTPPAPPVETEPAALLEVAGDVERCIAFCASHVTTERCFVVFSHGTCVIVDEPSSQPVIDAIHTLIDTASPEARFITREIEDGHHLITYRRAAFHCAFSDDISAQRAGIEADYQRYLAPAELKSMTPNFDPPFHAKLGLVARARLNRDAREPIVAKVIRAKPVENSAEPYEPCGPPAPVISDPARDPLANPLIIPPFLPGA